MTNANGAGAEKTSAPVAIIGFGAAGFNVALGLRRARYAGPIQVFSEHSTRPYSPILTSYYAAGMKTYDECFPWSEAEVDELSLDVHASEPVCALDVGTHVIRTKAGEYPYSKCVIATGAVPSVAGFPQGSGYEPLVLHSMEDAERLKAVVEDADVHRVLVSGASMVALKTVEALLHGGKQVTLVGMADHVLDMNALPAAAERFERGLREKGVVLRLGQIMHEVEAVDAEGARERALKVTFSDGTSETFDEIAVAHGMRSDLSFLEEGALEVDRGLLVDEFMRTSDADVYAAGDVAQAKELISGKPAIVGIWKNAALQGFAAGRAIAAELAGSAPNAKSAFPGSISSNTIAVDGTLFISAGTIDPGPDGTVEVIEDDTMTVVYVYRKGDTEGDMQLVGFNITSDIDEEGGVAYDTGAMLTLRILEGLRGE